MNLLVDENVSRPNSFPTAWGVLIFISLTRHAGGKSSESITWVMQDDRLSPGNGTLKFADCSVEYLNQNQKNLIYMGKKIKPFRLSCANDIVEGDEQCDCDCCSN